MKTSLHLLALAALLAGIAASTTWAGGGMGGGMGGADMGGMGGMGGGGPGGMGGGGMGGMGGADMGGMMGPGGFGGGPGGMGGGGRGGRGGRGGMGGQGGMMGPGGMTTDPTGAPLPGGPGGVAGPAGMGGPGGMGMMRGQPTTLQDALSSPADEWAVLRPRAQKVSDVLTLMNSATYNTVMMGAYGGGRTGRTQGGMVTPPTPTTTTAPAAAAAPTVASAFADLYQALSSVPMASDDIIRAKLEIYRKAREQAQEDLVKAREDLRTYVTLRQEAILISMGYLE